jgi:hypothetical protein
MNRDANFGIRHFACAAALCHAACARAHVPITVIGGLHTTSPPWSANHGQIDGVFIMAQRSGQSFVGHTSLRSTFAFFRSVLQ